jgi:FPC/CPF motif-containing protein YcgG
MNEFNIPEDEVDNVMSCFWQMLSRMHQQAWEE